ncbi:glycerophosphoryl diester phosphodiesterase membrane domain-containing protein [Kineococcus gynurae]|uniref:Glycerophosphoryl diester phosphodiesterase membrane domain-containing protein n=1 Tax=Kineococcus gynurae TaxID=452979 RepID=A0ABV5LR80_9ACTN
MSDWQAPDDRPGRPTPAPVDLSKTPGARGGPDAVPGRDATPGGQPPDGGGWGGTTWGEAPSGSWSGSGPTGGSGAGSSGGPDGSWGPAPGWGPPPAPRPGIVPLRPLTLGDIWDGAFRAFRFNPKVMAGVSAVVAVVSSVVSAAATYAFTLDFVGLMSRLETDPTAVDGFDDVSGLLTQGLPAVLGSWLVQVVALLVLNGLLILAVSRAVLGQSIGVGEVWRLTRRRLLALVGLSLVVGTVPTLVGIVTLAPGIAVLVLGGDSGAGLATGIGLVVLGLLGWLVVGVWLWVRWGLAAPALLLEKLGVGGALRRSAALVRGSFWRVLGILLLTAVVVYFVIMAVSLPFSLLGSLFTGLDMSGAVPSSGAFFLQTLTATVGSIIGTTLAMPFAAATTALVYIDLRIRREGLDVELHRAAGGAGR